MKNSRIGSLETLRGWAIICIIFFHTSIYNFANIHKLDFSNPPLIVVVMSFLALWGGIFIIYSSFINTYLSIKRTKTSTTKRVTKYLIIGSLIYLLLHVLLSIIFGRWSIDFESNQPNMTALAASIRSGEIRFPHYSKIFEGSSLLTLAVNLFIISLILRYLLQPKRESYFYRNLIIIGLVAMIIMIFSFVRVDLYPMIESYSQYYFTGIGLFFSIFFANPYPIIPYLAYSLFALIFAGLYIKDKKRQLKIVSLILATFFIAFGLYGMAQHEKTISIPDYFWYFKTQLELGFFILLLIGVLFLDRIKALQFSLVRWFSRVSLTLYLFETLLSEVIRFPMYILLPQWDQTINGSLIFGAVNVFLWIIIIVIWKSYQFKYSLEYWWVQYFSKIGKSSTKLNQL